MLDFSIIMFLTEMAGRSFLENLFNETIGNRPELLASLFPAFAMLCGDREGPEYAEVFWSLVEQETLVH